jgi:hypothetical protein
MTAKKRWPGPGNSAYYDKTKRPGESKKLPGRLSYSCQLDDQKLPVRQAVALIEHLSHHRGNELLRRSGELLRLLVSEACGLQIVHQPRYIRLCHSLDIPLTHCAQKTTTLRSTSPAQQQVVYYPSPPRRALMVLISLGDKWTFLP